MSSLYYCNITDIDTGATDQHAIVQIWNPSTTRPISLLEVSYFAVGTPGAGMGFITRRSSARGTAGSTVTPGVPNHSRNLAAPDSAFLIDLAVFTVQPTLVSGDLSPQWCAPAIAACGVILPIPRGIEIPPATGLVFVNRAAVIFQDGEWGFVVEEN